MKINIDIHLSTLRLTEEMEQIINDKQYHNAELFIQDHIEDPYLSDSLKQKLAEFYQQLTKENTVLIYNTSTQLYADEYRKNRREFNLACLKLGESTVLFGLGISLFGYLCKRFISRTCFLNRHSKIIEKSGLIVAALGLCMIFATGN